MGQTICATKHTSFTLFWLSVFLLSASCTPLNTVLPNWMVGTWETKVDGVRVTEKWTNNSAYFQGETSTHFKDNVQLEKIKLTFENDSLCYNISIKNKKCCFKCPNPFEDTLVFVNLKNDFPKRLVYIKPVKNTMTVWIDNFEGDPNRIVYAFKKIN
jgi:hypothetical protein